MPVPKEGSASGTWSEVRFRMSSSYNTKSSYRPPLRQRQGSVEEGRVFALADLPFLQSCVIGALQSTLLESQCLI